MRAPLLTVALLLVGLAVAAVLALEAWHAFADAIARAGL